MKVTARPCRWWRWLASATAAIVILIGDLLGLIYAFIPLGVLLGVAAAMVLFGRFAPKAQYDAIAGQPGAAAAILQTLRGGFTTTPAIAANRNMDVVHRTVGKPGVILVGEGSPSRLPSLLAAEKKRIARIANQVPIYDFQVGDAEGQIPIRQLQKKIMKLPRNLKGQAVAELNYRLECCLSHCRCPRARSPGRPGCPSRRGRAPASSGAGRPGPRTSRTTTVLRRFVMKSAQVAVHHHGRHHQHQQQRPDERPDQAHRAAVEPDHPQAH